MKATTPILLAVLSSFWMACEKSNPGKDDFETPDGYTLLWQDEFNETSVDLANWSYELGDGSDYGLPPGWGNNEKQNYTDAVENASIQQDGEVSALVITAREEGNGVYTSAKLTTQNLQTFRFGKIQVRAKMPSGQGLWPAVWMLGNNQSLIDWPGCGEIDILEVLGHQTNTRYSTLHFTNEEKKHEEIQHEHSLGTDDFSDQYHLFTLDWSPEQFSFSVDDQLLETVVIEDDMKEFLRSFYLIVNLAVGGNWPGDPDASTVFPQSLYIDYIRVFTKDGFEAPEEPELNVEEETVGQTINPTMALHAIQNGFDVLGNMDIVVYGGGGEPFIAVSDLALNGDSCLMLDFPGGAWGGAYIELVDYPDLSTYTALRFSIQKPDELFDAEIKLESRATGASVFLKDYTGSAKENNYLEYTIPLVDFNGLDLTKIRIPFAIWNPQDANQAFVKATVLIDNLYFVE